MVEFSGHKPSPHSRPPRASQTPDDWLARDSDVEQPLYLVVYPAPATSSATHYHAADARWSLAWPVAAFTPSASAPPAAWRHIQLEAAYDPLAPDAGPEIAAAKGFALGMTRIATRRALERVARDTPVRAPGEDEAQQQQDQGQEWSCQEWVREVLARAVGAGLLARGVCEEAVERACRVESAYTEGF
ncbi:uncharacterized protein BXZ73DRAFT_101886 [Epithele typhae]|uniref:uncharacterized protein n=1 Tax=Epithele typhae TaxID=378194 RepID=UPI00200868AD|nr:uncharacterized protein BXZ73DRAFT_101886 [Epithele typhae]KAH9930516.1 hypothetical protein BXZ73DRAFT_101886 [Epithele typhae]